MENLQKLIDTIVEAIDDKKGKGIVSLDLSGFDGAICSNFVVCHADSTTQVHNLFIDFSNLTLPLFTSLCEFF